MDYIISLYRENFYTYILYYIFVISTPLLFSFIEPSEALGYVWMATGVACFFPIAYNSVFGNISWMGSLLILIVPVLAVMVFYVLRGLLLGL